ncbi:hypothetical protein [Phenylobacterium sp.]|uniref:hypothetical protein n=1 Tax=Phenylobacterium sp. TaxID=1871053 RepID=UPI00301BF40E
MNRWRLLTLTHGPGGGGAPPAPPAYLAAPYVSGVARVGGLLVAHPPVPAVGTSIASGPVWTWADGTVIGDGPTYAPEGDDFLKHVRIAYVLQKGGAIIQVLSALVGPIAAPVGDGQAHDLVETILGHGHNYGFDREVLAGHYVCGQQIFVLKDREFAWLGTDVPSVQIPAAVAFTDGAGMHHAQGKLFWANGAEIDPFHPFYADPTNEFSDGQGIDHLLAHPINAGDDAPMPWLGEKYNVDPGFAGAMTITPEQPAFTVVKSERLTGLTTPPTGLSWRIFQRFSVIHFVDEIPPVGAIAPSSVSHDKTSYITEDMLSTSVWAPGFTLPAGMRTLQQSVDAQVFNSSFQPFFGQFGEYQRLFAINPVLGESSGYSRDYAKQWANHLFAMHAEGDTPLRQAEMIRIATFGEQLRGLSRRMVWGRKVGTGQSGNVGAGQNAGYIQFLFYLGMMVHEHLPEVFDDVFALLSNELEQTGIVPPELVGTSVWPSGTSGFAHTTARHDDVGRYHWTHSPNTPAEPFKPQARHHFIFPANYETESAGQANQPCIYAMSIARGGPDGQTGAQVITGGDTLAEGTRKPHVIGYADRYRRTVTGRQPWQIGFETILANVYRQIYDATRDDWGVDRWLAAPDGITPEYQNQGAFLWPIENGFAYDFSDLGSSDPSATSCDLHYALDERDWQHLYDQPLTGEVTGLPAGVDIAVQYQRRNAYGPGPKSVNHNRRVQDTWVGNPTGRRMWVTTQGTPSGEPVCVSAPKLLRDRYPEWWHFEMESIDGETLDIEAGSIIHAGRGMWTGDISAGFEEPQWQRDGEDIPGAVGWSRAIAADDLDSVTFGYVLTPVGGGDPVASDTVAIPARPAQPPGVHFEHDMGWSLQAYYPGFWASLLSDSKQGAADVPITISHRPTTTIYDDNGDALTTGMVRALKSNSQPSLIANLAADYPVVSGRTYRVTVDLVIESYREDLDVQTRIILSGSKHVSNAGTVTGHLAGGYTGNISSIPKPRMTRYTFDVVATSTQLWLRVWVVTGAGGTGGGNPQIGYARVEDITP